MENKSQSSGQIIIELIYFLLFALCFSAVAKTMNTKFESQNKKFRYTTNEVSNANL